MKLWRGFAFCITIVLSSSAVQAQRAIVDPIVPNPGDVFFAVFQRVPGSPNSSTRVQTDNPNYPSMTLALENFDQATLQTRYPALNFNPAQPGSTGYTIYNASANILGVPLNINSTVLSGQNFNLNTGVGSGTYSPYTQIVITIPCLSNPTVPVVNDPANRLEFFNSNGTYFAGNNVAGLYFEENTYQSSLQAYRDFLNGQPIARGGTTGATPNTGAAFRSAIYACSVANGYGNPLVGSAVSQQFQLVTGGMDLATTDTPTPNVEGKLDDSSWGLGLWGGPLGDQGNNGFAIEGRVSKTWRAFKGSRSLLAIDVPLSYQKLADRQTFKAGVGASLIWQVNRRWSLEPRLAWGYTDAPDDDFRGQVFATTIASRYAFSGIGRGRLTIGNMAGYSRTFGLHFMGHGVDNGETENWTLMNGLAYDLPLKSREGRRALSLRGSYAFAHMFGDTLTTPDVHIVSASLGVRLREDTVRNRDNLLRVGFNGKFGSGYHTVQAFVGYRF